MKPLEQHEAIAVILGWSDVKYSEANDLLVGVPPLNWRKRNPISKLSSKFRIQKFTADMNAAMEFADYLRREGYYVDVWSAAGRLWAVLVDRKPLSLVERIDRSVFNTSASAAICEAGLKALGKWIE